MKKLLLLHLVKVVDFHYMFDGLIFCNHFLFGRYDMWSAGVVFLELILGSPDVFQISALTSALLDQHLEGWNEGLKELAHK